MSIKSMSVSELKEKMDQKDQLILVDVREQNEWDDGHIPQAQFLPLSDFENQSKKLNNKSAQIILQCRSGKRSLQAAHFLADQGYTNLTNLEGGILAWMDEGYDVTK